MSRLSVGLDPPEISVPLAQPIAQRLISFYQGFDVYSKFGAKSVDYIAHLSARYACCTFRSDDEPTLEAYALWLSLVWLIDGLFDKCRVLTCPEDIEVLIDLLGSKEIQPSGKDPILAALFEVVQEGHRRYLELIRADRPQKEVGFWLDRYLRTMIVPTTGHQRSSSDGPGPKETGLHRRVQSTPGRNTSGKKWSIQEYERWRLDSGAIMCVIWQLLQFQGRADRQEQLFRKIALVISYHNDIVSYQRDLYQGTPNLVSVLRREDEWGAMEAAVELTNGLYREIEAELTQVAPELQTLCLNLLRGSYYWTNTEQRYAAGVAVLRALQEQDRPRFYELLLQKTVTPGDPQLSPKKQRNDVTT